MEIFWTNGKGHGLKALEDISDGEFIIEYLGEVVTTKEFTKRSHEYSKQVINFFKCYPKLYGNARWQNSEELLRIGRFPYLNRLNTGKVTGIILRESFTIKS